ncbi:GNAT family N-acetyltransferase [Salibacterium aidingense]|uniref:GNAT family N-acetyltransferase n=1 Tax=Salibacterium aidingense TaxID=384933 RepID=UPI00040F807B|nr:GNAT family N-acetyltransferase [Salibacterium aidingense]
MEIRKMNPSQMRQSLELDQFAFQFEFSKEEKKNHERIMKPENTWIADEAGQMLSKVTILPMEVFVGGISMPMGGISGVATWPESRRGGLVRKLLNAALNDMKQRGYVLSFLYPFSVGFYRKFGWELFSDAITWRIKKEQLPRTGEIKNGSIRRIPPAEWPTLQEIYQPFAYSYSGMVNRDESWWRYTVLKKKKGQIAVYSNENGEDTGYLIYQVKDQLMKVHEFVALDESARAGMWSFIANHDSMIEKAEVKPAANDPSRYMMDDPTIEEKRESYFMARIVDMKRFLELYPFELDKAEELVLEINDKGAPWNNGVFTIRREESFNEVEHWKEGSGDKITMDINTAAAVFLGYLPVNAAAGTGKMLASENTKQKLADALAAESPFIYDFF